MKIGQIVYSIRGRDSGKYYVVVDMVDKFIYICNGNTRCLSKPKKKNITHVKLTNQFFPDYESLIKEKDLTDKKIRTFLNGLTIKEVLSKEV